MSNDCKSRRRAALSACGHKRRCRGIDCPKTKAKGGRAYDRKNASAPLGARTGKRRAAARTKRSTAAGSRRREQQTSGASQLRFLRLTVCGALFVSLVLLKLVLPGNLSAFRGTLAQWLVRDADFTEAFSAIGHAVAAPERFAESLGNAYVAVFGGSGMQDAAEVGGGAEIAQPDGANAEDAAAKPLPDYVLDAQPTLPFSYVSPLDGALTSDFGWREDPNTGAEAFHTGLDLAADEGTLFACFADGTVGVVGRAPCSANI
ncbi:MAG: M23 family metallopeptidase [Oscillospiraceae bacterium]